MLTWPGVQHLSVGLHHGLLLAPVEGEHLLPQHSLPCWKGLPTLSNPRQATPERMAGEQVRAVPIVPLHPRACVTVLQFTGDSSHLLSGGADGQVLVWPLVLCVARRSLPGQERGQVGQVQPRYTWTDHALLVTGRVSVGHGPAHHQQLGHDCQGVHHADRADVVLYLLHRPLHFRGDGQHGDHGVCSDQVRTDPLLLPPLPT